MLKKLLPKGAVNLLRRLKARVEIYRNFLYDASRFYRESSSGLNAMSVSQFQGRMFAKAHSIEKGLSMPSVRPFFGEAALKELVRCMRAYERDGGDLEHASYRMGGGAIRSYLDFHARLNEPLPPRLSFIAPFAAETPEAGGVMPCTATALQQAARGDFRDVAASRHSIRQFSDRPVDADLLRASVALAQHAPSVCNRQAASVYVVEDQALRTKALEIQGGNRGFGQEVAALLVVVCELGVFRDAKERYQGWIDGGLFSMTLMYALHYNGLGSCPLNWSSDHHKDRRLRALLGIPDNELVIMLLGVGHLKDEFVVAKSPRRENATAFRSLAPAVG